MTEGIEAGVEALAIGETSSDMPGESTDTTKDELLEGNGSSDGQSNKEVLEDSQADISDSDRPENNENAGDIKTSESPNSGKGDQSSEVESDELNEADKESKESNDELAEANEGATEANVEPTEAGNEPREANYESAEANENDKMVDTAIDNDFDEFEENAEPDDEFGDDFDDDDFGDFDDAEFEQAEEFEEFEEPAPTESTIPVKALNETDFANSANLQASVLEILRTNISNDLEALSENSNNASGPPSPKAYFSERSASLWDQLAVISPHVHPLDWKRSAIRRLLLISLGVPLDLDEILPKKNTKRLILPMTKPINEGDKAKSPEAQPANSSTSAARQDQRRSEAEALAQETEISLANWYQLAQVSKEALGNMDEEELAEHNAKLKEALEFAEKLLTQWTSQTEAASKDKEAFEGVIESLVDYAQRLRRKK